MKNMRCLLPYPDINIMGEEHSTWNGQCVINPWEACFSTINIGRLMKERTWDKGVITGLWLLLHHQLFLKHVSFLPAVNLLTEARNFLGVGYIVEQRETVHGYPFTPVELVIRLVSNS